jgi:transketolase
MDISILEKKANEIRIDLIKMLEKAGSGHTGGPLGMTDVFTALYFGGLVKYDSLDPKWEERDRVVLSNGHICPILYVALAHAGYFPKEELSTLRQLGSMLQGHPHRLDTPGVELSSGSLGQGISAAVGMAMGLKADKKPNRVVCLMGDGELEEGSCWEAFMTASRYGLDNLVVIVDRNYLQIDGHTENISCLEDLDKRFEAFQFNVFRCDGNNIEEFIKTFNKASSVKGKPSVILARTFMGQGVSFMKDNHIWHGKPPNKQEAELALKELGGN